MAIWQGPNRRKDENQPGRRVSDQHYCPLHDTHHDQIITLENDMKGKVGMKLFGIFIGSVTTIALVVAGWMISSQGKIIDSVVELKTQQATLSTKIDIHMSNQQRPIGYLQQDPKQVKPLPYD